MAGDGPLGQVIQLSALGEQPNGHTSLGNSVQALDTQVELLDNQKLLATVVGEALVANGICLRVHERVRDRPASQADALGARAAVEMRSARDIRSLVLGETDAPGREGGAGVRNDGRIGEVEVEGSAVDVERARAVLFAADAEERLAGADVDAIDVFLMDGRGEVATQIGDVDDELKAL